MFELYDAKIDMNYTELSPRLWHEWNFISSMCIHDILQPFILSSFYPLLLDGHYVVKLTESAAAIPQYGRYHGR